MGKVLLILLLAGALVALGAALSAGVRRRADVWTAAFSGRRKRVLLEDALKHLHDVEYRGLTASVESLAGALEVPGDLVVSVVSVMEAEALIERQGTSLRLTEEGRSHARRIVRIHRLWEKWLAEKTGVATTRWHELAEKRERRTSLEEAERLSERLGHPMWDPHGDPIPTVDGAIPPARGTALPTLSPGDWAVVVHLEDEPVTLYQELVRAGLHPGTKVHLQEMSSSRLKLLANGRSVELSPVAAANLTVSPVAAEPAAGAETGFEVLSDLEPGESASVDGILPACLGAQRRRLLDLGFVPGTRVTAVMSSASGDPIAFRIRGTLIALRRGQAGSVGIRRDADVSHEADRRPDESGTEVAS